MPWYEYSARRDGPPLPLAAVRLWHGMLSARVVALVDSGADFSLFHITYADELGLNRDEAEIGESTGASGASFRTYRWPDAHLELEFENERFPFLGAFADFAPTSEPSNLLGRRDFFQRYIVQFWDAAELMSIDLSPDFPDLRSHPPRGRSAPATPRGEARRRGAAHAGRACRRAPGALQRCTWGADD
jgi:hypothetical protein